MSAESFATGRKDKTPILLSVVAPYNNNDGSARAMIERLIADVAPQVADYEIVVVDNGSSEAGFADLERLLRADGLPNVQLYRLVSAAEDDAAAWAGVENALGDYVLVLDPRVDSLTALPAALRALAEGREVVFFRNRANEPQGLAHRIYRLVFRHTAGIDLRIDALPQRLLSKRVVGYLLQQPYPGLKYRTLPSQAGFSKATVEYDAPRARSDGRRRPVRRLRSALRLLITTTTAPLRIASTAALLGGLLNALYSLYVVLIYLTKPDVAAGWTTLSLQQSGMFFLLSLVMFILIEYLVQLMRQASNGPIYFLTHEATSESLARRERLNVETAAPSRDWKADHASDV